MTLPKLPLLLAALAGLLLLAAACSDDDDADDADATAAPLSRGAGPGISVAEARASTLDGPLLVNGFLVVQGDEAELCEALAESFPPQCGGDSLAVEGLDLDAFEGLSSEQATRWSEAPIQLLGAVEGGVLTVSADLSS
ncbi:MAG: hypothetical protein O2895_03400 [Chloroflexi bacterium]|nr:hypothetical protein [Chloroflexota bacterium]